MTDATLHGWSVGPKASAWAQAARGALRLSPPRHIGTRGTLLLALIGAALLCLVGVGLTMKAVATVPSARATIATITAPVAPTPAWVEIVKPVHVYSLEAKDLAKLPATYAARRRTMGEAREDVLEFGAWRGAQPALRLRILRNGTEAASSLDTAIARGAAEVGLSAERAGLPDTLATRFGAFEIADVAVGVDKRQCSGFRLRVASPVLSMEGLACGADGRRLARATLGCLVDRLDLASAGEDRGLIDFFAATDLHRNADCAGMRLAPDGVHAAWLDEAPPQAAASPAPRHRRHHHRH